MRIENDQIDEKKREEYLKIASQVIHTLELIDKKAEEEKKKNA